ncbi:MAG: Clp protease [Actinomycetota bacterium]|nr:Clp protease [Actinomycetota bacterium]
MFERFTPDARAVVHAAQTEARALGHAYVGTEHLLLGLAGQPSGVAADALAAVGVRHDELRRAVLRVVGEGFVPDDAAYLALLGIDLDIVRARVEEVFGPGALDMPVAAPRRRRVRAPWRRRRQGTCAAPSGGHRQPLTPRSKKVLELSLREALALRHDWIGSEHILLGIIRERKGLAAELLVESGVNLADLRQEVLDRLRHVA